MLKFTQCFKAYGLIFLMLSMGVVENFAAPRLLSKPDLVRIGLPAQAKIDVRGLITDGNGEPLIGVNVQVKGTSYGTASDFDGKYLLSGVDEAATLVFSYIGYEQLEVRVDGRSTIDVTLNPASELLDEVVVVGYGTQKKINLTGAVDQTSAEDIEDRPSPNLTRLLQGTMANLNIKMVDGSPTRSAEYNIRGTTSIGAGGNALVLIDGVEGDPNLVNPHDIESVSILKDASSVSHRRPFAGLQNAFYQ